MIRSKLCFIICENFKDEFDAAVSPTVEDIEFTAFPAACGCPPLTWSDLEQTANQISPATHYVVCGSACITNLEQPPDVLQNYRLRRFSQCFYFLAPPDVIEHYSQPGVYLLSSGWLARWPQQIERWGFDQQTAREFFAESTRSLLLLDSGLNPDSSEQLKAFAAFVDRPYATVYVGLEYLKLLISKITLDWRLKNQQELVNKARQQTSEYAMAMDLLNNLSNTITAPDAIDQIVEQIITVFGIMFAAADVFYLALKNGQVEKMQQSPTTAAVDAQAILASALADSAAYTWTKSGSGFLLKISAGERWSVPRLKGEVVGVLGVDQISFPEFKERYLDMALNIVGVFGLVMNNARAYQKLRGALIEKEMLLSELNHRTKNNLNIINSIVQLQAEASNDAQFNALALTLENRVHSIAMVHEMLYRSPDLAQIDLEEYAQEMVELLLSGFSIYPDQIEVEMDTQPVLVGINTAIPCGQILNELIANAFKYAFPSGQAGRVYIHIHQAEDGEIILGVADNGVGLPASFDAGKTKSLGMTIVRMLTEQLQGAMRIESNGGLHCEVRFRERG